MTRNGTSPERRAEAPHGSTAAMASHRVIQASVLIRFAPSGVSTAAAPADRGGCHQRRHVAEGSVGIAAGIEEVAIQQQGLNNRMPYSAWCTPTEPRA